jgi:hypothetical protein
MEKIQAKVYSNVDGFTTIPFQFSVMPQVGHYIKIKFMAVSEAKFRICSISHKENGELEVEVERNSSKPLYS